jgi:hypothetical protein
LERLEKYHDQGHAVTFQIVLIDEQWYIFARVDNTQYSEWNCVLGERSGQPNTMDVNRLFNQICKIKDKFPGCPVGVDTGRFRLVEVAPDTATSALLILAQQASPIQIGAANRALGLGRGALRMPESIVNGIRYLGGLIGAEKVGDALRAIGGKNDGSKGA